jgi:midasin
MGLGMCSAQCEFWDYSESAPSREDSAFNGNPPRKRRKLEKEPLSIDGSQWLAFVQEVEAFNVQHIHHHGKFAFGFVEGPLIQALKNGHW